MKRNITVVWQGVNDAAIAADRSNKQVIFKNCAPFTDCISEINNSRVDNAKDLNIVIPMYNLIECSENYANTSGSLWQCCRDKPNKDIANSESFKFESALANNTDNAGREKTLTIDDTKL